MLYLIWAILNLGILVYFFVTFIDAAKLLREKRGWLPATVFVFALLSAFLHSNMKKDGIQRPAYQDVYEGDFVSLDTLSRRKSYIEVDLENNWIAKKLLIITYGKGRQGQVNIPTHANSTTMGFWAGTTWTPTSINVSRTADNDTFQYVVLGEVRWQFIGWTIYTQKKKFTGLAAVDTAGH